MTYFVSCLLQAVGVKDSQILSSNHGLAGFQVMSLEVKADSYSNKDVSVSTVITDMALLDMQPESQAKSTGYVRGVA